MQIAPYTFIDAERLRYGRYPVLDTVVYRWMRRIEETLFEQAGVEVYAGASVFEEMKFATFYTTLRRPRPIYLVSLEPLRGTGLFVADNRFAAFCLHAGGGSAPAGGETRLTRGNQARLQRIVQALLADFDACWRDVEPVHTRLRKITTYPFRARVLNPYESCLVAQIHLAGHNISSRLTWCLPKTMLEPLLPRLRESRVLPPEQIDPERSDAPDLGTVLRWLNYDLQVRMGQMTVRQAAEGLEVGAVLPLEADPDGALIELEGTPVLRASMGEVEGRYAFQVEGPYVPPKRTSLADPASFRPVRWPEASGE